MNKFRKIVQQQDMSKFRKKHCKQEIKAEGRQSFGKREWHSVSVFSKQCAMGFEQDVSLFNFRCGQISCNRFGHATWGLNPGEFGASQGLVYRGRHHLVYCWGLHTVGSELLRAKMQSELLLTTPSCSEHSELLKARCSPICSELLRALQAAPSTRSTILESRAYRLQNCKLF